MPDWKTVQDHLAREGKISKEIFVKMINDTMDIFSKPKYLIFIIESEPNLLQFPEPLVMVGDIHGQLYDLIHLLEKAGDPGSTK